MIISAIITKLKDRNSIIFIVCIFLATFFWISSKFGDTYQDEIEVPVTYINYPKDKVFLQEPPGSIAIKVSASGWNLLKIKFIDPKGGFEVDLVQLDLTDRIPSSTLIEDLNKQLKGNYKIISINPPTLSFYMDRKVSKRVPVKTSLDIEFSESFGISGQPLTEPESIVITGPATIIDTLKFWKSERLSTKGTKSTFTKTVKLKSASRGLILEMSEVNVTIPVSEFREMVFDKVPVKQLNCDQLGDLMIFPNNVKVSFMINTDKIDNMNVEGVYATVNCSSMELNGDPYLKVSVRVDNDFIRDIKMEPEFVEYSLYK